MRNEDQSGEEASCALDSDLLVSVIIPSFNHEEFVEQAINSVLSQSYPTVQLVVVDDGSSDSSIDKISALQADHNFDFIAQRNRGVCAALNRGIYERARGKYIAILASDDIWHKDKLSRQIEALRANPRSEFCFAQAKEFFDDDFTRKTKIFPRKCAVGWVLNRVFLRQHVPAGTMVFSRRIFEVLGGFDDSLLEEDWDFVIRCAAETQFTAVEQPLLYYRNHGNNIMKVRGRRAIYQQKALLLSKNFHLVSPFRWAFAMTAHFFADIMVSPFLERGLRGLQVIKMIIRSPRE